MSQNTAEHSKAFPKVRILRWGQIPRTRDLLNKSEFVESLQKGFFLHNDGTEAALSVQLEKLELACGPEQSISIISEQISIKAGEEVFMPVFIEKPKRALNRYDLVGTLAKHFDSTYGNDATWPLEMEIPVYYTYGDWLGTSYRINSNLIFRRLRPIGIVRFEIKSAEYQGTSNKWLPLSSPSEHPRSRNYLMSKRVLNIIGGDIREGKTPKQCLIGKLKNISDDPWLKKLQEEYPDVESFGDIADKQQRGHEEMFIRFKAVFYRLRKR